MLQNSGKSRNPLEIGSVCVVFLSPFASFSPFASSSEDTAEEILAQIGSGNVCVSEGNWELVSDAAKVKKKICKIMDYHMMNLIICSMLCQDIVTKMLHVDPHQRLTAPQV